MADENNSVVPDEKLDEVSGGQGCDFAPSASGTKIKNGLGRTIGEIQDGGRIIYWPCPKCHRPTYLYLNTHHCDPCDDWWWSVDKANWEGTEQALKDAAR